MMDELLIKYRFQVYPYIVADGKGEFYQLPHVVNKYSRLFRKLNLILNNGISAKMNFPRRKTIEYTSTLSGKNLNRI